MPITRVEPSIVYTFPTDSRTPKSLRGKTAEGGKLVYAKRVLCVRFPGITKPVKVQGRAELEYWANTPPYGGWVLKADRQGILGWEDPNMPEEERSWANGDFIPFFDPKPVEEGEAA